MSVNISTLRDKPWFVNRISDIYLKNWGRHFAEEWNVTNLDEMIADLRDNYMDHTYVATDAENGDFVGTVALLDKDLLTHVHLSPWITCLYVEPWCRNNGVAKALVDHVVRVAPSHVRMMYLWCVDPELKGAYERMGACSVGNGNDDFVMALRRT